MILLYLTVRRFDKIIGLDRGHRTYALVLAAAGAGVFDALKAAISVDE
jgi:hypothetical protein